MTRAGIDNALLSALTDTRKPFTPADQISADKREVHRQVCRDSDVS